MTTPPDPQPADCGECRLLDDFEWDPYEIVNDAPVIVCKAHLSLAPGWAYSLDVDVPSGHEAAARRQAERDAAYERRSRLRPRPRDPEQEKVLMTAPTGRLVLEDGTPTPWEVTGYSVDREVETIRTEMGRDPDPAWVEQHEGHEHRWTKEGQRHVVAHARRVLRHIPCDGSCGNWDCEGYTVPRWLCVHDGTDVAPGTTAARPRHVVTAETITLYVTSPEGQPIPATFGPGRVEQTIEGDGESVTAAFLIGRMSRVPGEDALTGPLRRDDPPAGGLMAVVEVLFVVYAALTVLGAVLVLRWWLTGRPPRDTYYEAIRTGDGSYSVRTPMGLLWITYSWSDADGYGHDVTGVLRVPNAAQPVQTVHHRHPPSLPSTLNWIRSTVRALDDDPDLLWRQRRT